MTKQGNKRAREQGGGTKANTHDGVLASKPLKATTGVSGRSVVVRGAVARQPLRFVPGGRIPKKVESEDDIVDYDERDDRTEGGTLPVDPKILTEDLEGERNDDEVEGDDGHAGSSDDDTVASNDDADENYGMDKRQRTGQHQSIITMTDDIFHLDNLSEESRSKFETNQRMLKVKKVRTDRRYCISTNVQMKINFQFMATLNATNNEWMKWDDDKFFFSLQKCNPGPSQMAAVSDLTIVANSRKIFLWEGEYDSLDPVDVYAGAIMRVLKDFNYKDVDEINGIDKVIQKDVTEVIIKNMGCENDTSTIDARKQGKMMKSANQLRTEYYSARRFVRTWPTTVAFRN